MHIRTGLLALVLASTVAVTGCGASVSGTAGPMAAPVDVSKLNTGPYSPQPTTYEPADLTSPEHVRVLEAYRFLDYLAPSTEIDPELTELGEYQRFATADSLFISKTMPEKYRPALADNKLLAGVWVSRINDNLRNRKKLIISIMQFPTDEAAGRAADALDRITNDDPGRHRLDIDGYPAAKASSGDDITGIAFLTRGPYVVLINSGIPQANRAELQGVVKKALDRQLAHMEKLTPTPWEDVLDVPFDPQGIMRRALPKAGDYSDGFYIRNDLGALTPSGQLVLERDPEKMRKAFESSGVDLVGRNAGIVYRTADLAASFRLQNALVTPGKEDEEIAAPPDLPDARCVKFGTDDPIRSTDQACAVVRGRYVGLVFGSGGISSKVDKNLYIRAAAQYAILANSE